MLWALLKSLKRDPRPFGLPEILTLIEAHMLAANNDIRNGPRE